ncbi:MAG: hypothetical protein VKJ04_06660 [Vampirovibrionales bacterium]|nr:hypothetical protein [Vampirovibrionales bacterium]
MALKKSEKQLVAVMLFVCAGAAVFMLGLPNLKLIQESWAAKTSLETEIKNSDTVESSLRVQVETLKQQMKLPNDIIIRKHTPENLQANVKEILNKVLKLASRNNNKIISLAPWSEVPPILPPQAAAAVPAETQANTENAGGEDEKPAAPAPPPLTVVGYELSLRGSFEAVQGFLKEMEKQTELVDISSIQIVNEQGPDRGAEDRSSGGRSEQNETSDAPIMDPTKPIKLIAQLRLVLEPQKSGIASK